MDKPVIIGYNKAWAKEVGRVKFLKQHPEGEEWFDKTFPKEDKKEEKK